MLKIRDDQGQGSDRKHRKRYHQPRLQVLGDLRAVTLGGSPGTGDSGGDTTHFPKSGLPQPGGFPPLPEGYPGPYEPPRP